MDVVDYVLGSASITYNDVAPIFEPANHKIIWRLKGFPSQTKNKEVTFSLKTNSNYNGKKKASFKVTANARIGDSKVERDITTYYQYAKAAPIKTPITSPFSAITLTSISETEAKISLSLNGNYPATVKYGLGPSKLDQSISSIGKNQDQEFTLSNLQANTQYYFKFQTTDESKKVWETELFTFETATISTKPQIDLNSLIVSSSNQLLTTPDSKQKNVLVMPEDTNYEIRIKLKNYQSIKDIKAVLKNKKVLGINSQDITEPNINSTNLEQSEPGIFIGRLKTPSNPGVYQVSLLITDSNGNVIESKLADVKVTKNLTVLDQSSKSPIEKARLTLSVYNPKTNTYDLIPEQVRSIQNPSYTNGQGESHVVLPEGKYKVEVLSIGFKKAVVEFELGPYEEQDYPTIYLEKAPFSPLTVFEYYGSILQDVFQNTKAYVSGLSNSIRFFELNAIVATSILIFLTLLSITSRLHIPLHSLPEYLRHWSKIQALGIKSEKIKGRIFDQVSGETLKEADIYLIDLNKNKVVDHTKTNSQGDFAFLKLVSSAYEIDVLKDGYEPETFFESDIKSIGLGGYLLNIKRNTTSRTLRQKVQLYAQKTISIVFEGLLIISAVFEFTLGYSLGWSKAFPFIMVSMISVFLWLTHLSHLRSIRNIF
ncbi:carboxypeptidase regulatory-like domain-containing protein [Candidatus Curtissbacteria bacterium]|nr:carboxypeptidase regulatory-like domain-containing protein [Candidatus Curtissbacteria bacterium]